MTSNRKKSKAPKPDKDGYVSSGIYSRFAGTPDSHPEEYETNAQWCSRSILETTDELFARLDRGFRSIPKDDNEQYADAVAGVLLIQTVRNAIAEKGDIPWQLVHFLIQLGELTERVQVRPFEHAVEVGNGYIERANSMRLDKCPHEKIRQEATKALAQAEKDYPTVGKTRQKHYAAVSLGIGISAFYERLKKT